MNIQKLIKLIEPLRVVEGLKYPKNNLGTSKKLSKGYIEEIY